MMFSYFPDHDVVYDYNGNDDLSKSDNKNYAYNCSNNLYNNISNSIGIVFIELASQSGRFPC